MFEIHFQMVFVFSPFVEEMCCYKTFKILLVVLGLFIHSDLKSLKHHNLYLHH